MKTGGETGARKLEKNPGLTAGVLHPNESPRYFFVTLVILLRGAFSDASSLRTSSGVASSSA